MLARTGELPLIPRALRALRWVVVALLVVSTGLTLFAVPELRAVVASGRWPRAALLAPPLVLAAFVVGFAVYRIGLVRLGRYGAGKALMQIGLMSLVLAVITGTVLFPEEDLSEGQPVALDRAIRSRDATVRVLAAELARHRPPEEARRYTRLLADLLDDPAPEVRRQAHASLVAIVGSDVGGEGPGASSRWRAHLAPPANP